MKLKTFLIGLLIASSKALFAGGGTSQGEIAHIYVNNHWTMVHAPSIKDNPDSCQSTSYYAINPADKNYQTLHSTLLAAQLANRKVRFWLSGCGGQNGNHPKIISVWVY